MELNYTFSCTNCVTSDDVTAILSSSNLLRQDLVLLLELSVFSSILFSILLVVVLGYIWRQSRY